MTRADDAVADADGLRVVEVFFGPFAPAGVVVGLKVGHCRGLCDGEMRWMKRSRMKREGDWKREKKKTSSGRSLIYTI